MTIEHAKWRRAGYLPKTSLKHFPKQWLFIDTETYVKSIEDLTIGFPFRLAVMIYVLLDKQGNIKKRYVYRCNSKQEFVDTMISHLRKKEKLYVVGHNIGFDIRVLDLPFILHDLGFSSQPPVINERLFIWSAKNEKGSIQFIDTANYGISTVKRLGEDLKLNKQSVEFDTEDIESLFTYCEQDAHIVETFILQFVKYLQDNDLGEFEVSLAKQSLTSFRHKFMHSDIFIHMDNEALLLERSAYHGGRVELFKHGTFKDTELYGLDINSMYPYVMHNFPMPIEILSVAYDIPISHLKARLSQHYVIAEVLLDCDKPIFGVIFRNTGKEYNPSYFTKSKAIEDFPYNKLIFPIGTFKATLHHNELLLALELGYIKNVYSVATYNSDIIFDNYIDFFYKDKVRYEQSNNPSYRLIAKLFMNSLYGKMGQTNTLREFLATCREDIIFRQTTYIEDSNLYCQEVAWFGEYWRESKGGESTFSNPAIAGAVTSLARLYLWQLMELAGLSNLYYVDTDSLIVNKEGYENLKSFIDSLALGKLKLEKSDNKIVLRAPKDYEFGGYNKHKGIKDKSIQTDVNRWSMLQFQSFISWMNEGGLGEPTAKWISKTKTNRYNKGTRLLSGNVAPLKLSFDTDDFTSVAWPSLEE